MKKPKIRFKGFNDDWEQRKLGEVAENFEYGLNAAAKEFDGVNKYIRITDIDDDSHKFNKEDLTSPDINLEIADRYKLEKGDILFARTGASVGKSYIYRESDGLVYYAGFLIRGKIKRDFDEEFVFQNTLTENYENYIRITSQRSGQPGVNAQEYQEYTFKAPNYPEQKQIGDYFRNFDYLITLHQRKCDEIKKLKKYMLQNMFPQDEEKVPKVRFNGFTDAWEQRKLENITFPAGKKNKNNLPYESYSVTNESGFIPQNEQFENGGTLATADKSMYYIVSQNSFAYNPARINIGSIGYYDKPKNVIVSSLYEVFKTTDDIDDRFLWHWFKGEDFQKMIERYQEGGVRLYFYYDKLCMCRLLVPSIQEQRKIGKQLDTLDRLITLHQRKCDELKNMKKFMLQNMFL